METTSEAGRRGVPTAGTTATVHVRVLGDFRLEHDGRVLHVAGTHRRRLLALLASRAGQSVGVDAIVDALWGEDPPPTAAKTIQSHVARLRASLTPVGRELIETTPGGYRLVSDGLVVDAAEFERLAAEGHHLLAARDVTAASSVLSDALELWSGVPYGDVPEAEFAAHERTRLEQTHSLAIEDAVDARLESGGASAVIPTLERLVADDPGRERAWALLMRALYASGQQQEALVAFQRARHALADEFGLEPGPALRDLEARVLAHDPELTIARRAELPT
ncbi:MAG TPA: AfsR/SARP family transcriptional regulator, partial [Ilumatobacteraceae bacterium]|nr:AfsR/SARP family transcriptional regulator [Ilumatobacteraceae bacterium]